MSSSIETTKENNKTNNADNSNDDDPSCPKLNTELPDFNTDGKQDITKDKLEPKTDTVTSIVNSKHSDDNNANKNDDNGTTTAKRDIDSITPTASIVECMIYEETLRQIEYAWEAQRRIARKCFSKDDILRKI